MIELISIQDSKPYDLFYSFYNKAILKNQPNVEAISVGSYDTKKKEVDSRLVNLKYINNDNWVFFSNYNSVKALQFSNHNQISVNIFWHTINLQIRIKAQIQKISKEENQTYFENRSLKKNALAISSSQSCPIESYERIKEKYEKSLESENLKECPDYWGGYSFNPYFFEFWEGHKNRLNKRNTYELIKNNWKHTILQP